ncbi:histidine phosphatase family protein [Lawsonibacter sp. JLR.KK007]|jgi:broad specificity phosphatase PhoE|uniref:histidine phosphatase family protein n=1 Tax=Lawsonibacter sp. JLR.KK007 TaxID=3114293 RepID=UPI002FEF51EE
MKRLYLVRYGESIQNVGINQELRMPDHAIYLTEKGMQQASNAGKFIAQHLDGVPSSNIVMWVSPYKRTRETAGAILKHINVSKVKEDDMLTELQFGIFDAIPKEKIPELFPEDWERYQNNRKFNGKFYARRPGGESPFDCEIRQKLFLDTLFRDIHNGCPDNIIIVGHGAALTILRKAIFHYNHEWYAMEHNPGNCSIQSILLDNGTNIDFGYIYGNSEEN